MTLFRLYGLTEATRADRQISLPEIESRWPEAMAAFDRDVGREVDAKRTSFYLQGKRGDQLIANVHGGGWWQWDPVPTIFTGRGGEPGWTKIGKPASIRGGSSRFPAPDFQGNPGSHQHRRATQAGEQEASEEDVSRMFGVQAVRLARKIQPNPELRTFGIYPTFAYRGGRPQSTTGVIRRKSGSETVVLNLYVWADLPENPIESSYEWDERSNSWKGPY